MANKTQCWIQIEARVYFFRRKIIFHVNVLAFITIGFNLDERGLAQAIPNVFNPEFIILEE